MRKGEVRIPTNTIVLTFDCPLQESQAEDDSDMVPFTSRSELLVDVGHDTPLDYFSLMVNETMIEVLVVETNRYAEQTLRGKILSPRSRFHQWVDVTSVEMRAFLGLIIRMGLIVIENMTEYWKDRFFLIQSFFHVADNGSQLPRDHPHFDPLYKIRTWGDALNQNFMTTFAPGRSIAIDKAMTSLFLHVQPRQIRHEGLRAVRQQHSILLQAPVLHQNEKGLS